MDISKNRDEYNITELLKNTLDREKNEQLKDIIVSSIYAEAEEIATDVVVKGGSKKKDWDKKLDDILTSRYTGFPIMFLLLGVVFWITIIGSNLPSEMLSNLFFKIEDHLTIWFM